MASARDVDPMIAPTEAAEAVSSLWNQGAVEVYIREKLDDTPAPAGFVWEANRLW